MIYIAGIIGAIAVLLLFFESSASAGTTAGSQAAGDFYPYPAPPADSFSNAELGDTIMGSSGAPVTPEKISLLAQAIATAEGFYNANPDVVPRRAHNPGDLTRSFGEPTTGIANSEGVLDFSDDDAGWSALKAEATAMLSGGSQIYSPLMTVRQVAAKYTGNDNSDSWAQNVAGVLGISADQTLKDFLEV